MVGEVRGELVGPAVRDGYHVEEIMLFGVQGRAESRERERTDGARRHARMPVRVVRVFVVAEIRAGEVAGEGRSEITVGSACRSMPLSMRF